MTEDYDPFDSTQAEGTLALIKEAQRDAIIELVTELLDVIKYETEGMEDGQVVGLLIDRMSDIKTQNEDSE